MKYYLTQEGVEYVMESKRARDKARKVKAALQKIGAKTPLPGGEPVVPQKKAKQARRIGRKIEKRSGSAAGEAYKETLSGEDR